MGTINYLNLGCGKKIHKEWVNVDMVSNSEYVIAANLFKGIPFPNNHFDVIYHSQVLEHFPKEKAQGFLHECFRVLKPNGIIRIVVPDLEDIVRQYMKVLNECIENPNEVSAANYDWILLEMLDQMVRNYRGGQVVKFLQQPNIVNENYIFKRIGFVGRRIRDDYQNGSSNIKSLNMDNIKKAFTSFVMFKNSVRWGLNVVLEKMVQPSKLLSVGKFRLGGEVHMWMYDRYSLSRILDDSGFVDIAIKNPFDSDIPNWSRFELDVKEGVVYDPNSLFMEAKKGN